MSMEDVTLDGSFIEKARDKVKTILLGLIPEDKLTDLVQNEFDKFFLKKHKNGYGDSRTDTTKFEDIVQKEMHDMMKKGVLDRMNKLHNSFFEHNQEAVDEEIRKIVTTCSASVMHNISNELTGNTLQRIINDNPNGAYAAPHNGLIS